MHSVYFKREQYSQYDSRMCSRPASAIAVIASTQSGITSEALDAVVSVAIPSTQSSIKAKVNSETG
jgi:hypothetical protein